MADSTQPEGNTPQASETKIDTPETQLQRVTTGMFEPSLQLKMALPTAEQQQAYTNYATLLGSELRDRIQTAHIGKPTNEQLQPMLGLFTDVKYGAEAMLSAAHTGPKAAMDTMLVHMIPPKSLEGMSHISHLSSEERATMIASLSQDHKDVLAGVLVGAFAASAASADGEGEINVEKSIQAMKELASLEGKDMTDFPQAHEALSTLRTALVKQETENKRPDITIPFDRLVRTELGLQTLPNETGGARFQALNQLNQ